MSPAGHTSSRVPGRSRAFPQRPGCFRPVRAVRPLVLAAAFLSSLRIAMRMWIEEDLTREPAEVIGEILDEMARSFE
ncbi:hypothetical protein [Streptomyces sp. NBC_00623]|uniref:hypothetical protein n=1 Tax=unclassified Streptomyces TaxID=2593676 RepID=UPI0030E5A898